MKWNLNFSLGIWLRAIRFKFLAASAISVTCGLVLSLWADPSGFDFASAILVYLGILCLHCSVDLLNDYFDFKRGIDLRTKKTKFSGGTGVLPEGLLSSKSVYLAGITFLFTGLLIGGIFVLLKGYVIGIILSFAAMSIMLYSTKLVNVGLGETFVGIKGMLIVIGTFYVQTSTITTESIVLGMIAGLLSAVVLFINSIPDINADREGGRKTLAILLDKYSGKVKYYFLIGMFTSIYFTTILFFVELDYNIISIVPPFFLLPLAFNVMSKFYSYSTCAHTINDSVYIRIMEDTVLFSRLFGIAIVLGIVIATLLKLGVI
ncbi:MAG: prenyltransferase [Thermoproteota archaeon]|nr:prenyltransferase [Thermoproteota archaeon]